MKKALTLTLALSSACILQSENRIVFSYDIGGNRTIRETKINPKSQQIYRKSPIQQNKLQSLLFNEIDIKIHPNPTTGPFEVNITSSSSDINPTLLLYNISGVLLESCTGNTSCNFDLYRQPDGVYLLHVSIGSETKTFKILKN